MATKSNQSGRQPQKGPTKAQLAKIVSAQGAAHVLSIGVGSQLKRSGFSSLAICANDAKVIFDRFKSNAPLNANIERSRLLENPSRNQMLDAISTLSEDVAPGDRLFVFFSGHGVRINDALHLVPQDALKDDDPAQLVALNEIEALLEASSAKEKYIFIDACYSGAELNKFKGVLSTVSAKELSKLVAGTRGVYILSSSGQDEQSTTQSRDGLVSLFTDYLARALAGDPAALNDGLLTFESLAAYVTTNVQRTARSFGITQRPTVSQRSQGIALVGDYRAPADATSSLDLRGPQDVRELVFQEADRNQNVKDIVPRAATWRGQEYIENRVNDEMEVLDASEARSIRASLRNDLMLMSSHDRNSISFDDGAYSIRWEATEEKRGHLVHEVTLESPWLARLDDVPLLLSCLGLNTRTLKLSLGATVDVQRAFEAFKASDFVVIEDGLPDQFTVKRDGFALRITLTDDMLEFSGFTAVELFGDLRNGDKVNLVQLALRVATSVLRHAEPRRIGNRKRALKNPF